MIRLYWEPEKMLLHTYSDCVELMKSCRNKARGKPIKSSFRLTEVADGSFVVSVHGDPVCRITADNKLIFLEGSYTRYAQTLSQGLNDVVPIAWNRVATGRWRVAHTNSKPFKDMRKNSEDFGIRGWSRKLWDQYWGYLNKFAPEYFPGITFDLVTGECTNRRPDYKARVNPEAKKAWLRKVRSFKRMIRVQTKMGVWKALAAQDISHVEDEPDIAEVMACMDTGVMTERVQQTFARLIANRSRWRGTTSAEDAQGYIDNWFNNNSIAMRRAYGVFEGETK